MGRQCTVCAHADLEEINKLLLCSDSYRDIARQFGLSKDSLARHKESHIPTELLKSKDIQEVAKADVLLVQLVRSGKKLCRFSIKQSRRRILASMARLLHICERCESSSSSSQSWRAGSQHSHRSPCSR